MTTPVHADYVIAGSGAVGMAFADVLVTDSDATVAIIDRYAKPGGHWNVAYPFVTLHQPAAFYGVSSRELSSGILERGGLNDGLAELSSGAAVSAYFDDVMRHQFLPSGRVQWFPMCEYDGGGRFSSTVTGERYEATWNERFVNATFLNTSVPATHTPNFTVAGGVHFIPLNDLPTVRDAPERFVVVGGGKTGVDACLWLLEQRVDPDKITWVVSRDAWMLDRQNTQNRPEFFEHTIGTQARFMEAIVASDSPEDMFLRLEACGYFVRIDTDVLPEMFHGATVSQLEIEALRRIDDVVRLGRVTSIGAEEIVLERGSIPTGPGVVHVDCSASALKKHDPVPVFDGDVITPQLVRPYQPVFSAALAAHVELTYDHDETRNRLCGVVPLPDTTDDFIRFTIAGLLNENEWSQDRELRSWIAANRLDGAGKLVRSISRDDTAKRDLIRSIRSTAPGAVMKLMEYEAALETGGAT